MTRARALLALPLALAAGCQDTPPDATGVMERPAGLLVVQRDPLVREDLFIADSEAQGVRLQQFAVIDGALRALFALAPAVFFPLVIPARGYPSELAHAPGQDRLYAMSPAWRDASGTAVGALHVLEIVGSEAIQSRATDPSNVPLGVVPLSALEVPGIPMDVEVVSATGDRDRVAVLFDDLGRAGQVAFIDVSQGPVSATLVAQVEVGRSPRQLVKTGPGTLMVALADPAVLVDGHVAVVRTSSTSGEVEVRWVPVGGPVSRIIPLPDGRAVALRQDRPSVVVIEADGTVSTRQYPSPHTPVEERGTPAAAGRIDLPTFAVSGAYGPAPAFPGLIVPEGGTVPVVMLVMLDGHAAVLVGDDLEPRVSASAAVVQSRRRAGEADPAYVRECDAAEVVARFDAEAPPPTCPGIVQVDRPQTTAYRAVYRGALLSSRSALFSFLEQGPEGALGALEVPEVVDLEARLIQPGDGVLLQLRLPACADGTGADAPNLYADGVVQRVRPDRVEVLLTDFDPAGAGADRLGCVDYAVDVALVEVFPAGEEVVLQTVSGETPSTIQTRVPVVTGPTGQQVARIESTPSGLPTDLAFTLASATGFTCEVRTDQRRCTTNVDCGAGRGCVFASNDLGIACPGACDPSCGADASCLPEERVRACSGVELVVGSTDIAAQDLGATDLRGAAPSDTEVVNAVPYDTVWLPIAAGWVTSFPGSRDLLLLRPRAGDFVAGVTR